jgi:hypothetical protein
MMRGTTLILAGAALCASFAFADGSKNAELQLAAPGQMVMPKRMMKVRWDNGRLVPATPWIELGDFAPAGPCDPNEVLVFDHFGTDASGNPIGGANCRSDFAPSTRWFFGPTTTIPTGRTTSKRWSTRNITAQPPARSPTHGSGTHHRQSGALS